MAKNIVICADGTGNKFSNENTNVVRLYQTLKLDNFSTQISYYHGGLGTMGAVGAFSQLGKRWTKIKGMAFGSGLSEAIAGIYTFLMDTYEEGDRIYLYGFSRGAYTVRALSGMLEMFGLLRKHHYNQIDYAIEMLRAKQSAESFQVAAQYKATFSQAVPIHFMGVWDTVSSVQLSPWEALSVPYTAQTPNLMTGRHALAIDERRCFFRQNLWGTPLDGQNLKQVWFAGVHSDVGGGYPEAESGLSKLSLEWMMQESVASGLIVDGAKVAQMLGTTRADGEIHPSLKGAWLALEALPHRHYVYAEKRWKWKLPLGQRRRILETAVLHESVRQRMGLGLGYAPLNLPQASSVEPWVRWSPQS